MYQDKEHKFTYKRSGMERQLSNYMHYLTRICSTSSLPIVTGMLLFLGGSGALLFLVPPRGVGAGLFGCRGMLDVEESVAPMFEDCLFVKGLFSFK